MAEIDSRARDALAPEPTISPSEFSTAPAVSHEAAQPGPPTRAVHASYRPDIADGADALGMDSAVRGLAELAVHRSTRGPLTLGLLGPAGSGKSFALGRLVQAIRGLSQQARREGGSPFLSRVVVAHVEAGDGRHPATAVAAGVFAALGAAAPDYANLAHDAASAGADPQAAARAASERLIDLRRRLDAERQALQDLSGRRARLSETVLYRSGGSRIDSWARTNRSRIEGRLRAFGFASGDPISTYKDLVRDVSENRGAVGRLGVFLHAMWAFRGQARLITFAVLFALVAWLLGEAQDTQPAWLGWLRGGGAWMSSVADWIASHAGWFATVRTLAIWASVACVALNVWRAARFVTPLYRGAGLLDADMLEGQRDLDVLIANQTRLVDDLATESDAQARRAEEAERRAITHQSRRSAAVVMSPFEDEDTDARVRQARGFLAALARDASGDQAPERIVVAIDDLDSLSPQAAAAFVDEACALLGRDPFVTVLVADPRRLATGWGEGDGADRLARRIQAALRVDAASSGDHARLVRKLLGEEGEPGAPQFEANASILDQPIEPDEASLLEALAPMAGRTPRRVKQFVNAYRLARARTQDQAALALALAIDIGGEPDEREAMRDALVAALPGHAVTAPAGHPRLAEALHAAVAAKKAPITAAELRAAQALAASYSLNL